MDSAKIGEAQSRRADNDLTGIVRSAARTRRRTCRTLG